ncbi:hypothetical protein [Streptacidiphilus sp. EB129]|uniref:hypothetical protein n=1 Tax=Streptacidiphilus sp. EB129 TaxID=3156262 RepID=UPI003518E723
MSRPAVLAGALQGLGNHFIGMFAGWALPSLEAAGGLIVVVTMVRRFSLKAGIGAALALVLMLGIYQSRAQLASMFTNEVQTASTTGAAQHSLVMPLGGTGGLR